MTGFYKKKGIFANEPREIWFSERTTHFDDFEEFLRAIDTSDIQSVK